MSLIQRAINISLKPTEEWQVIEPETSSTKELLLNYVAPLAAIPAIASFIGTALIGSGISFLFGHSESVILATLLSAIASFVFAILGVFLTSLILNALAPSFDTPSNPAQAIKIAAYAFTPAWLAGILNIIPLLGVLGIFAAFYSVYVLYLGLPILLKTPKDKAVGLTAVTVILAFVVMMVFSGIASAIGGLGLLASGAFGHAERSEQAAVALAGLAKAGQEIEAAAKKAEAEAAKKQSPSPAEVGSVTEAVANEVVAEVLDGQQLQALLPDSAAGLKRTRIESNKTAMGNFKISFAEAEFGDGAQRAITIKITDTGGSSVSAFMFAWGLIESEKDTEQMHEKMGKVNGRPTHEMYQKDGSHGEYSVVIANRYSLEVQGRNVDMATLKSVSNAVGYAKLEALKDAGIKK